ncbi:hypothetical protein BDV25DRAFT_169521 [Aspergillus avenaceus]|uniref:Protein kinase domain-containing protein n=1 Tax=Aspergillus avenaceus TaxID=36643 RepID=A0A5N6TKQ8_ASPAV|nr:hypothetical protein BDV25DRAFT_169521 [Aspergillus avenaceus]
MPNQQPATCPYVTGNTITLRLDTPCTQQPTTITGQITQVFEPFTLSSAMVIILDYPSLGLGGEVALKLFDRRFATQFREDEDIEPWTLDIETQYLDYIRNGSAAAFIRKLDSDSTVDGDDGEEDEEEEGTWTTSQNEAYLHHRMRNLYETEVEVYHALKEIQGKHVPRLYACVTVAGSANEYTDIPGVLLQYVRGFQLRDIAAHAPRDAWQGVCEEAISIVHRVGEKGVLNKDVKTRSFIVSGDAGEGFRVFMIDFALCRLRREYRDDEDWWWWKALQDEEGAVGFLMQKYLKGGFVYRRSELYEKLDLEFKSEG